MSEQPATMNDGDRRAQFERLYVEYQRAYAARDYERALTHARVAQTLSRSPETVYSEALCLQRLGRSQEAFEVMQKVAATEENESYHDLMAEICGALGRNEQYRAHGAAGLAIRDRKFANGPRYPIPAGDPPSSAQGSLVIAYSLYGSSPRYCEVAIMNCRAAAKLLPEWQCRFYCDETVPADVRRRIVEAAGEVVLVDDETRHSIPPLMWRFLVADDRSVARFLGRDADSLIGEREAAAVAAWIESGKWFHVMRDYYSHSELMLAGLWGGCRGAIPDMKKEMIDFLAEGSFGASHVDQHFLRKRIWPTARQSVLSHDSQFEFFNNEPFPEVPGASLDPSNHVGANLSTCSIAGRFEVPGRNMVQVSIFDRDGVRVCEYETQVRDGRWQLAVPDSYANEIQSQAWIVRLN